MQSCKHGFSGCPVKSHGVKKHFSEFIFVLVACLTCPHLWDEVGPGEILLLPTSVLFWYSYLASLSLSHLFDCCSLSFFPSHFSLIISDGSLFPFRRSLCFLLSVSIFFYFLQSYFLLTLFMYIKLISLLEIILLN